MDDMETWRDDMGEKAATPVLLMTAEEVAIATGMSRSKVYLMMSNGTLPSLKIGKNRRVAVSALHKWIESQTAATCPSGA
jgi:excisionase family DNA binding protein